MKDTMDNEWNDMEDDNNFLNMDPNAAKVSFTFRRMTALTPL